MRRLISVLIPISLSVGAATAVAQGLGQGTGYGQVIFDNQTPDAADMYVDDAYGCRALGRLTCTAQVPAGTHVAEFRFDDDDVIISDPFDLDEGESITLSVPLPAAQP